MEKLLFIVYVGLWCVISIYFGFVMKALKNIGDEINEILNKLNNLK